MEGRIRVSVVATGIDATQRAAAAPPVQTPRRAVPAQPRALRPHLPAPAAAGPPPPPVRPRTYQPAPRLRRGRSVPARRPSARTRPVEAELPPRPISRLRPAPWRRNRSRRASRPRRDRGGCLGLRRTAPRPGRHAVARSAGPPARSRVQDAVAAVPRAAAAAQPAARRRTAPVALWPWLADRPHVRAAPKPQPAPQAQPRPGPAHAAAAARPRGL
jgi:cell division protein FtsZ